jgi:hypothetical protein
MAKTSVENSGAHYFFLRGPQIVLKKDLRKYQVFFLICYNSMVGGLQFIFMSCNPHHPIDTEAVCDNQ